MSATPAQDSRTRRSYQLGALLVTTVAIAAVLVAVLTDTSAPQLAPGKPVPGATQTLALFTGIPQRGIALGDPRAPVTLVELGDLQCPYCAQFARDTLPTIVNRYVRPGRVRLLFRNLDGLGHDSRRAAQMAAAVGEQNRLWEFVDLAYRNQGEENSGYVTDNFLRAIAGAIPSVNVSRAMTDRGSAAVTAQITQAMALARRFDLKVTPSFLLFPTGQPPRQFSPAGLDSSAFTGPLEKLLNTTASGRTSG